MLELQTERVFTQTLLLENLVLIAVKNILSAETNITIAFLILGVGFRSCFGFFASSQLLVCYSIFSLRKVGEPVRFAHQLMACVFSSLNRIKSDRRPCHHLSSAGTVLTLCQPKTRSNDLVSTAWGTFHNSTCTTTPLTPACQSLICSRELSPNTPRSVSLTSEEKVTFYQRLKQFTL